MTKKIQRIDIEDTFQRMLCEMVPEVDNQNIRPAYQQNELAGKYITNEFGETEVVPFTPHDNFIYFTVIFDSEETQSYTFPNGDVELRRGVSLQVSCYGEDSEDISSKIFSLIRADSFMYMLQAQGLFLQSMDDTINQLWENVNEEWIERHDFTAKYNKVFKIENPLPNKPAKKMELIVEVDDSV